MAIFDLGSGYSASFIPYRHGLGYVAKGTIFCGGKPVAIFEAHRRTLPELAEAARARANEVCKGLKRAKRKKRALRKDQSSRSKLDF